MPVFCVVAVVVMGLFSKYIRLNGLGLALGDRVRCVAGTGVRMGYLGEARAWRLGLGTMRLWVGVRWQWGVGDAFTGSQQYVV